MIRLNLKTADPNSSLREPNSTNPEVSKYSFKKKKKRRRSWSRVPDDTTRERHNFRL
jgi:hypothetical protein